MTGVRVDVVTHGRPRPLSPGAESVVYRVIQESLTNVLKHANPPEAVMTLEWHPDTVTARIIDNGRPVAGATNGHGLIGMRERATLYSGTLSAQAHPDGGFEVALTLPTQASE